MISTDEIKEARKRAGLTQREAAELIHSTEATWRAWEAGRRKMHSGLWELFLIKTSDISS